MPGVLVAQWLACLRVVMGVVCSDPAETDRVSFSLFFSPKLPRNYMENIDKWLRSLGLRWLLKG